MTTLYHGSPLIVEKPEYASGVVPIEIHPVNGIFKSLDALVIFLIKSSKEIFSFSFKAVFKKSDVETPSISQGN